MLETRRRGHGDFLDHFERDHLSRDLGEALHASADVHEPVFVELHHVAGLMPSRTQFRVWGHQYSGILIVQIAQHDIGTAHMQHAAALDAGHRHQCGFHSGKQLADAADPGRHRRIDRDDRRGLGYPVALVDAHAELFIPDLAHRLRQLLGAGNHVAHAVEIVGMRKLGVVAQKRAGTEKDGATAVVDDFGNQPVVQRRRIKKQLDTGQDRQQPAGDQTERVENRQRVEDPVFHRKIRDSTDLGDIGKDGTV